MKPIRIQFYLLARPRTGA